MWSDKKHIFHERWKKIINYFVEKTFSVSEGALLETLKLFFCKMKMHPDFLVLYSKHYLYKTTSVHCSGKNLELVRNKFFMDFTKKIIKHFAEKNISFFNRAPSDTQKVFFNKIIYYFFFNISEKCVLYQFSIFISAIHWCCQKLLLFSVKYFKICICKIFLAASFFFTTLFFLLLK